jgi:predicted transcriptional regulator
MGIPLDPKKLKLKYELKVYRKMDSWPSSEDVLYEVARYVEHKEKSQISKTKILDMVSQDSEKLQIILDELIKKQFLKQDNETTFTLLKHGWE